MKKWLNPLVSVLDVRVRKLTGTTIKIYLLSLLTVPISTRLFGPEEFGVLNTFVAILCVFLIPSMLKLEVAVGISRSLLAASMLARTAFTVLCFYSTLVSLAVCTIVGLNVGISPEILDMLPLLPLAIFGAGMLSLNAAFFTASGKAENVNDLQYKQLVTTLIAQVVFGIIGFTKYGLILADVIGRNVRTYWMCNCVVAYEKYGPGISFSAAITQIKTHWRYPAFVMTGNLGRYTLSYAIPIATFHIYGAEAAGFLAIAQRLSGLPRTVIASAFNATLTSDWREAHLQPNFMEQFKKTSRIILIVLGATTVAIAALMIVGAPFLLGPEWGQVGVVVCLLGVFYCLDAHLFSLAAMLQLRGLQSVGLFTDVFAAVSQLAALYIAMHMEVDFISAAGLLGAFGAFSLFVSEIVQFYAVKRSFKFTRV